VKPTPPPVVAALPKPVSPPPATPVAAVPPQAVPGAPPSTVPGAAARPAGGGWTVEANPTRNRDEAEALQTQLRHRGYDAVVTHVQRDGETWYRLRVGRYQNSEQASQVMRRLREQEGVARAFVASE
jgi:DedD protein